MKRRMLCLFVVLTLVTFIAPIALQAQEQAGKGEASEEAVPDPKELGEWWLKSAREYDPLYPNFLYHIEGDYSFTKLTGNTEATVQQGGAKLVLRMNIFPSWSVYNISKNKTTISTTNTTIETEAQGFFQSVSADLTKRFALDVGMKWSRDQTKYVENRYTYFGGVNATVLDAPIRLRVGAFYGLEDTSYMNDKLGELVPGLEIPDYDSTGVLITQELMAPLSKNIIIMESADYLKHFEDDEIYQWNIEVTLSVQITPTISTYAMYKIAHDQNKIVENPVQALQGYEEEDTTLSIGVNVSFP
jgi:hypothetical protein